MTGLEVRRAGDRTPKTQGDVKVPLQPLGG